MIYKTLFEEGVQYNTYLKQGDENEVEAVCSVKTKINKLITHSTADKLTEIKSKVNLLVVGEMWCPDCQLNITAMNHMSEQQALIKLSIINKGQAEEHLLRVLELNEIKIPLVIILNANYQLTGLFVERPSSVKSTENFNQIEDAYFAGNYLDDTVCEIMEKIKA